MPVWLPRGWLEIGLLVGSLVGLAAACAPTPSLALPQLPGSKSRAVMTALRQVELQLDGPLPAAGELGIAHEAGTELRLPLVPSGSFLVHLPPGPAVAILHGSDGRRAEFAFVVGPDPVQPVRWQLPTR